MRMIIDKEQLFWNIKLCLIASIISTIIIYFAADSTNIVITFFGIFIGWFLITFITYIEFIK